MGLHVEVTKLPVLLEQFQTPKMSPIFLGKEFFATRPPT